jgi:hypothetical protein
VGPVETANLSQYVKNIIKTTLSCYLPSTKPGLRYLYSYTDMGCPVTEVSPHHLRAETDPLSETLCSLDFGTLDNG